MAEDKEIQSGDQPELLCKHCGKDRGSHKGVTFHCPLPNRLKLIREYHPADVYEPAEETRTGLRPDQNPQYSPFGHH
ncbi:hypothetical protein V0M98_33635 (plasmid) [Pseudomonas silesiensis]|uniref:hypothetical protein n=1 Tax=Pseudomonas silesiensis TaxID=1853130 RepID=UPI0030CAC291